ncbi:PspC domain-containing protein [Vagococcus jeotgali]|uniref:PspC domain-containing protein n=1 Tax=Vagococcus jeotgali TaxID=3109030 RepID=UPI002DD83185|nr:PspC domain-containing protein [Vagococcus sp. B2T-5]
MGRRLTKSSTNIVLTGTLAGIAEYFRIDPTLVRIIYVLLSFFTLGSPVILYIVLALIIPSAKSNSTKGYRSHSSYKKEKKKFYGQNNDLKKPRKEAEKIDDDEWSDF